MYIKEIEIDNFKSFAEKVTIPFLEGFTTISGPNGSGKSNIIDSVLFALGLSSSRTLRAEKLFDLINTHNKRSDASVKITFNQNDNDISVTRKIKKSSSNYISSYYMNNKASTLSEIHEVLAKYNVSPGCYNVMMQGDVTGIINMSAFERRKVLDEIAGVADFDRRIEQAKKELETVEERVEKSNIIINEIDIRLIQLEEERSVALKYQKLKEEKQGHEGKLSIVKYFEMKTSMERLHESILDANKTAKEEHRKQEELLKELEHSTNKFKEISELVKTKGEDEQIEIKKQIESLKGSIARKQDAISYIGKQIGDNKGNSESSKENISRLKEKIEDTLFRIESKQDQIKVIESNIKREKEELDRILGEVSGINKTANEHIEKRNAFRRKLEAKQDEENAALKEKLGFEEKVSRFERDINESQVAIEKFNGLKTEYISRKDILVVQVEELSGDLKDYEIQLQNCLYELDKVKNELNDSNYNLTLAHRRVSQLEATKKVAEDFGLGKAVDTVMNAGLSGIHAPLAQLGQVDKEYSTALEIAMGGRMRSIVVDNDEVASVAIEILKSARAGRATFLPLNKIQHRPRGMRVPNIEGVVDYAINLVNFDPIYEQAFYYALGDTIIVEDMNAARKLIGKYRMVTLDGSLVEKTGAMTGGSMGKSNVRFGQSEDDELKIYRDRLQELEIKVNKFEKEKFDLERRLDKIRGEYSSTMNELNRKKIELENIQRNLGDAETTIKQKQELIEATTPELVNVKNQLFETNNKLAIILEGIYELTKEIKNIENSIPKDDLSRLNDLTDSIEFEIKNLESKLANCHNDIKAMNMEIDFNREAIGVQEEKIKKHQKDNMTLEQEKELHRNEIRTIEERLKDLNEKIKEIGSELIELQQERDAINQEVLNLEKKKAIHENKIERLKEQVEAYKARRKELEPEFFAIRDELTGAGHNISVLEKVEISVEEVNRNITRLQRKMEEMEPVNMKALVDYDEVQNRRLELKTKIDTLSSERNQIIERMGSYEDMKLKSFGDTFENVNSNFKVIFEGLCDGIGSLVLENPESPFSGGMTIEAQPRSKKMQRLESMSGGEKSITALAFVFAIQRYLPAPFYAFDEVDMHLDGINVEKLAHMIKHQAENTQFIVVSLRKPMIESANRTIGVTQKNNGITKVTGVKFSDD